MNRKPKKYIVIALPSYNHKYENSSPSKPFVVGETVYELQYNDYGGAAHDTRLEGVECTSVTRDPTGNYPYQTIPKHMLKEIPNA